MKRNNAKFYSFACSLVVVTMFGFSCADKFSTQDEYVEWSEKIDAILNHRINGPVQLINQDIHFLFAMIQGEAKLPMVVSPDFGKKTVTLDLIDPTVGDVFEELRKQQLIDYEINETNGDSTVYIYAFGKKVNKEIHFPKDPGFSPVIDHPVLQKRLQGSAQFVNQEIEFLFAMLKAEFDVSVTKMFAEERRVTFNLINPTLQLILDAACFENNLVYQIGSTERGVEIRIYDNVDL